MNNLLSGGLLGMGGFGGMNAQSTSLLGEFYDPKMARNAQIKNMLLGMGVGLMSERGLGRGAELALTMGNQAQDDYRQMALDQYRMKQAQDEREYQRGRDAKDDAWRQQQWDYNVGRQGKVDAWTNTQNQAWLEDRQREEDMRLGQQNAVEGFAQDFTAQGGDLFSPGMQGWLRGQGIAGVDPQDTQRYDRMQPFMAAQDYGGAFQQMTAEQAQPDLPNSYEEYLLGQQDPAFLQHQMQMKRAGGVNVDARQMGNIPPGYTVEYDKQNRPVRMVPIPGGPAAAEAEKADSVAGAMQNKRMTMTDTVTNAADTARELAGGMSTGLVGQGMSLWGETDAAEVYRQTDVLKATATIENLNAMRRESPTGGALGNVTEKEGAMLAAAAGAIDPASGAERFQQQLDKYELTLMRVIHGYEAGTQIFSQRKAMRDQQAPRGGDEPPPGVDPNEWQYMTPEERQLWQQN
jgi:hypothetical protein